MDAGLIQLILLKILKYKVDGKVTGGGNYIIKRRY
jgi:hypothetical protein